MFNTMNINLGGDNSISNLAFIWSAYFKNNIPIFQFDLETGKENRFKLVKEKFDDLDYFILWNKEKAFKVDLINGLIFFNNNQTIVEEFKKKKTNIRLIFFRRHKVKLSEQMIEKKHEIIYFLGFQYQDENKNNHKIILQIDKDGNWIIGD